MIETLVDRLRPRTSYGIRTVFSVVFPGALMLVAVWLWTIPESIIDRPSGNILRYLDHSLRGISAMTLVVAALPVASIAVGLGFALRFYAFKLDSLKYRPTEDGGPTTLLHYLSKTLKLTEAEIAQTFGATPVWDHTKRDFRSNLTAFAYCKKKLVSRGEGAELENLELEINVLRAMLIPLFLLGTATARVAFASGTQLLGYGLVAASVVLVFSLGMISRSVSRRQQEIAVETFFILDAGSLE